MTGNFYRNTWSNSIRYKEIANDKLKSYKHSGWKAGSTTRHIQIESELVQNLGINWCRFNPLLGHFAVSLDFDKLALNQLRIWGNLSEFVGILEGEISASRSLRKGSEVWRKYRFARDLWSSEPSREECSTQSRLMLRSSSPWMPFHCIFFIASIWWVHRDID